MKGPVIAVVAFVIVAGFLFLEQLTARIAWDAGYSTAFNAEYDLRKSIAVRQACSPYDQIFDSLRCYREMVKQGEEP